MHSFKYYKALTLFSSQNFETLTYQEDIKEEAADVKYTRAVPICSSFYLVNLLYAWYEKDNLLQLHTEVHHVQVDSSHCYICLFNTNTHRYILSCTMFLFVLPFLRTQYVFPNNSNYRYSCTTLKDVATYTVLYMCFNKVLKCVGLFQSWARSCIQEPMHHQNKIQKIHPRWVEGI